MTTTTTPRTPRRPRVHFTPDPHYPFRYACAARLHRRTQASPLREAVTCERCRRLMRSHFPPEVCAVLIRENQENLDAQVAARQAAQAPQAACLACGALDDERHAAGCVNDPLEAQEAPQALYAVDGIDSHGCDVAPQAAGGPALLTPRELATVLAALRYWQANVAPALPRADRVPAEYADYFDAVDVTPYSIDEIDGLCERLNLDLAQ